MNDDNESKRQDYKDKLRSLQFPRQPIVDQVHESGSTQVHHTSGRVDADVHIAAPIQGLAGITTLEERE